MMAEIRRAQVMGFCGGVKRAIILAEQVSKRRRRKLHTVGSLIHNDRELERLENLGLEKLDNVEQVKPASQVLVRAHGETKEFYETLKRKKATVVEGICPLVRDSRNKILEYSARGYYVVLAGEKHHAEVEGLISFATQGMIISSVEEAKKIKLTEKSMLLSQSTWPPQLFAQVVAILKQRYPKLIVEDTICDATLERQRALKEILKDIDALVVVGDSKSSNTHVLYRIGIDADLPTWLCSSAEDVPLEISSYSRLGLTAGASAPEWLIMQIEKKMHELCNQKEK